MCVCVNRVPSLNTLLGPSPRGVMLGGDDGAGGGGESAGTILTADAAQQQLGRVQSMGLLRKYLGSSSDLQALMNPQNAAAAAATQVALAQATTLAAMSQQQQQKHFQQQAAAQFAAQSAFSNGTLLLLLSIRLCLLSTVFTHAKHACGVLSPDMMLYHMRVYTHRGEKEDEKEISAFTHTHTHTPSLSLSLFLSFFCACPRACESA